MDKRMDRQEKDRQQNEKKQHAEKNEAEQAYEVKQHQRRLPVNSISSVLTGVLLVAAILYFCVVGFVCPLVFLTAQTLPLQERALTSTEAFGGADGYETR